MNPLSKKQKNDKVIYKKWLVQGAGVRRPNSDVIMTLIASKEDVTICGFVGDEPRAKSGTTYLTAIRLTVLPEYLLSISQFLFGNVIISHSAGKDWLSLALTCRDMYFKMSEYVGPIVIKEWLRFGYSVMKIFELLAQGMR